MFYESCYCKNEEKNVAMFSVKAYIFEISLQIKIVSGIASKSVEHLKLN
jgi:hypothetical protein